MLTAPEDQLPGRVSAPRGAATAARRRSRTNAPWWFFAALVVSVVPILAVYFVLQRSIINGFAGGLKG